MIVLHLLQNVSFSYKNHRFSLSLRHFVLIAMRYLPSLLLATVLLILVGEGFGAFICSGGADCTQTGRNVQPFECTDGANCKKCVGDECWPVPNIDGSNPLEEENNKPIWRNKRSPSNSKKSKKGKGRKCMKRRCRKSRCKRKGCMWQRNGCACRPPPGPW